MTYVRVSLYGDAISVGDIRRLAWAIFREVYKYPSIPYRSIGPQCLRWSVREAARRLRFGTDAQNLEREAQTAAARYGNDPSDLSHQFARWQFGSLADTRNAAHMRAVFSRAIKIAQAECEPFRTMVPT